MDTSTIIAICALLISLGSFIFSIRNTNTKNRIEIAEKQTDLLRMLSEARIILDSTSSYLDAMYSEHKDGDPEFSKQLLNRKKLLKSEYDKLVIAFKKFEDYSKRHDPIKLEQLKSDLNNIILIGRENLSSFK